MNITKVAICNMGLFKLGTSRQIAALTDSSLEAIVMNTVYDLALEKTLESARWPFATKRLQLVALAADHADYSDLYPEYPYQYPWPSDCVRVLEITNNTRAVNSDNAVRFQVEATDDGSSRIIFTDQQEAVLVYIQRVTSVAAYPALFIEALAWQLASQCAIPIAKSQDLQRSAEQQWMLAVNAAFAVEANERVADPPQDAEWVRARL